MSEQQLSDAELHAERLVQAAMEGSAGDLMALSVDDLRWVRAGRMELSRLMLKLALLLDGGVQP